MRRSTERILTTHVGSLARPRELLDLMRAQALGESYDADAYPVAVRDAVATCVSEQAASGLDTVSMGNRARSGTPPTSASGWPASSRARTASLR